VSSLDHHPALADTDPLAIAFRASFRGAGGIPGNGGDPSTYYLLVRSDTKAVFATGSPPTNLVRFGQQQGRWIWQGSGGDCSHPHALLPPGLGEVDWALDSAYPPPGPADTTIHVLVTEPACAGGKAMGDRLSGPEVVARGTQMLIAFGARSDGALAHTCQGNPSTPVTVPLPEPLGNRTLADGGFVPPVPASVGSAGPIR
jgi:hypothetical protein